MTEVYARVNDDRGEQNHSLTVEERSAGLTRIIFDPSVTNAEAAHAVSNFFNPPNNPEINESQGVLLNQIELVINAFRQSIEDSVAKQLKN